MSRRRDCCSTEVVRLRDVLEANRSTILSQWEDEARRAVPASKLGRPALVDNMPHLLAWLAQELGEDREPSLHGAPDVGASIDVHVLERTERGFQLSDLVRELSLLRACVFHVCHECSCTFSAEEAVRFTALVDGVIERTADRYHETRTRILHAFEQIADAAFNLEDIDAFLQRLVEIFMQCSPSIDSVAILLREGETLHVRATIGLEEEVRQGFTLRVGEGFAGTIAATRKPLLLGDAARNPLVRSATIHAHGTRALYGVPLVDRDAVVGVAHIGTRLDEDIPPLEKRVFAALAQRATSAIVKHRLNTELRRAMEEMKRAADFRERFLGIVSHDLRNPMTAIAMRARVMLATDGLSPDVSASLGKILSNVDRMERIVSELLDFTRGRLGGGIPVEPRHADLAEIIERVVEELEITHPTRRIERTMVGSTGGVWDPNRLAQVISNLVGNALQHGDPAGTVRIDVDGKGDDVLVMIENPGKPIPKELIPHVFEAFRSGAAGDTREGLGLGLFIACEITRSHGGRIDVTSCADRTTFTVRLPRRPPPR